MRYLTIKKFATESGYTEAAVRSKIADGTWLNGQVWRRAPDGRVLIDVGGYEKWVERNNEEREKPLPPTSKLHRSGKYLSPLPLDK